MFFHCFSFQSFSFHVGSKGKKIRGDEAEEADNSKGIKDYLLHPFGLGWKYLWNILLYK